MFFRKAVHIKSTVYSELAHLQSQEVSESDVRKFSFRVNDLITGLNKDINNFDNITFVELPNIDDVKDLKEAIIENGEFKKQSGNIFENGGFNILLTDLENAIAHCQRLDQKSVGTILDCHKKLHKHLK